MQICVTFYLENGISPSTLTIVAELGIANGTAYKYVVAMAENGMIEYDGKSIETPITKKLNKENTRTAIVGSIPCGSPQYEEKILRNMFLYQLLYLARKISLSLLPAEFNDKSRNRRR